MHRVPQVQPRTQLQVAWLKGAFEQQDGAAPIERAQALRLVKVEQGKAVGAAQSGKTALDAVAIGIGLDHRPHMGIWRTQASLVQVVTQGFEVDGGKDGAGHGESEGEVGQWRQRRWRS